MKKQIQRKPKEEAEKKKKEQVVVEKKKMTKRKMGDESLEMEKKKRRSTVGATENSEKKERKVKKGDMGEDTAKKEKSRKKIENVSSIADDEEEAGNVSCSFPMSRVRRLMRLEGGNANVTITGIASNAVFLVNKASVITLLPCPRPILLSFSPSRSKISPSTVHGRKGYEFLSEKMRAEDALKAMASVKTSLPSRNNNFGVSKIPTATIAIQNSAFDSGSKVVRRHSVDNNFHCCSTTNLTAAGCVASGKSVQGQDVTTASDVCRSELLTNGDRSLKTVAATPACRCVATDSKEAPPLAIWATTDTSASIGATVGWWEGHWMASDAGRRSSSTATMQKRAKPFPFDGSYH
ncbi:hypothetical protein ZIOFF_058250 [Zingiber officinale]|uniref:Uncharacterized protein n=1 Tax=Zingiber officinale TaxID=94328 RepID=A0A8J5F4K3_ZINOF|nr:hypothetical protein ZIOFF_058250 [Zingiber officinale]